MLFVIYLINEYCIVAKTIAKSNELINVIILFIVFVII